MSNSKELQILDNQRVIATFFLPQLGMVGGVSLTSLKELMTKAYKNNRPTFLNILRVTSPTNKHERVEQLVGVLY